MQKVSKKQTKQVCIYCTKKYTSMARYINHLNTCSVKKKIQNKDTSQSVLAHKLWCDSFHNTSRKNFDFLTFSLHRDYNFFMKVAEFCLKLNIYYPTKYMNWCIKNKIKFPLWTTENNYEKYIKHAIVHENPVDAVIRSIDYIKNGYGNNFFDQVKPGNFLNMIEMGRISPWLIILYKNAKNVIKRMSSEQYSHYNRLIDKSIWNILEKRHADTCDKIKTILSQETF